MATQKLKTTDSISPFYLGAVDNPGLLLTNMVLKGDTNYDSWSRAMKNALRGKNKLGFIDGSIKKPKEEDVDESHSWVLCYSMVSGWIHNTIDPGLQPYIYYFENSKELWDDLKERYVVENIPRMYQLKANLSTMKQQGMTVG